MPAIWYSLDGKTVIKNLLRSNDDDDEDLLGMVHKFCIKQMIEIFKLIASSFSPVSQMTRKRVSFNFHGIFTLKAFAGAMNAFHSV
jgi:hypothetical protein